MTLGEQGPAPRFVAAVKAGTIEIRDSTCPAHPRRPAGGREGRAVHAAARDPRLRPGAPPAGLAGHRQSLRATDDPILLVPAIRPDVALFHAARADRAGNVWIGVRRELMRMAHAATDDARHRRGDHRRRPAGRRPQAAGTIPALYVSRDRRGAARRLADRPAPAPIRADLEHLRRYAELARDEAGFARYLDEFVLERRRRPNERLPARGAADRRAGGHAGWARPRRGRRRLADPGRRGAARARALGRPDARLGAGQRAAQPVHRRRASSCSTAPRRGGSTRSSWAAARSTARPTSTSSASAAIRRAEVRWPGSFGSAYHVLPGAARDPVPRGAHAPRAGAQGGVRQRPRHQPAPTSTARAARTRW